MDVGIWRSGGVIVRELFCRPPSLAFESKTIDIHYTQNSPLYCYIFSLIGEIDSSHAINDMPMVIGLLISDNRN